MIFVRGGAVLKEYLMGNGVTAVKVPSPCFYVSGFGVRYYGMGV